MSDLETNTELWVLRAKVATYEKALGEAHSAIADEQRTCRKQTVEYLDLLSQFAALQDGVRSMAHTLRKWAVAAGGHTPSAIVASKLLELIGDEKPVSVEGEATP